MSHSSSPLHDGPTPPRVAIRRGRKRFVASIPKSGAEEGNALASSGNGGPEPTVCVVLTTAEKRSLRRKSFSGLTFEHADLSAADFRLSRFSHVVFRRCDLRAADLRGAEIRDCEFLECDLAAARFGRNCLQGSEFCRCRHVLAEQRERLISMGARWRE